MAVKDDYQDFKNALSDLKMNNKSSINFLTLLAEDKIHNAQQIVRAIEERILETKGDYVLPSLYVLDSIVKNLRSPTYIQLFENKLPIVFASAFNKVDERTRLAMFKLRQTWPAFFSNAVLYDLDTRTHYIDPAWPITARTPDTTPSVPKIHINPDFVQRNSTSSTLSNQQGKSSTNTDETTRTNKEDNNNYHMIPIDRKEIDNHAIKTINDEQQLKVKETNNTNHHSDLILINEKSSSENEDDNLFGGTDIDYRDTDNSQTSNVANSETDRLFKLNSECLSLAEEKYKSKELSSEEYQATLKLLQTILQNEVQRLTIPSTNSTTTTTTTTAVAANSFPTPSLSFPSNTPTTSTLPNFSFAGFGNDTQRHALQILAAANATSSYAMPFNFLPFIPPLPPAPAPPPFTLASTTLTTTDRHSPNKKRTTDDNSNSNIHSDQTNKRQRRDSLTSTHGHNFDEENIAPVPSLIDANINTLKKTYLGVIQQLYIGKCQCRLCGLRFTAKQKHVYTHHLDWHYWENRQAATNQTNLLECCRDWYPSLQEWIVHEENLDEQIKINQMMLTQNRQTKELESQLSSLNDIKSCSAKGDGDVDNDRCYVCHDPFENFFDDNREEWRLKDAIRVDGKTYHPVCYEDVQFHDTNVKISAKNACLLPESLIDDSSNQSSDSQLVDNVLSIVNIKQETNGINDRESLSSSEDSTKADYVSSMSFVNLAETIFIKKEDLKPIENFDDVKLNVKEELIESTTRNQDIPFLAVKPENDCEFFNNQTSSDQFRSITE